MLPRTTKTSLISSSGKAASVSKSPKLAASKKPSFQRPASVLIAEEVVYEAEREAAVETASPFDQGWAEYQAATQKMKDLEALSAQLLLNLEELNSVSEAFDGASLQIKASPSAESLDVAEARRSKRAAAREARKLNNADTSSSSESLASTKASLEALVLKESPIEVPTASATIIASPTPVKPTAAKPPRFLSSGPSLASGPSLPAFASDMDGTIASSSNAARESNARRARVGRRDVSASASPSSSALFATSPSSRRGNHSSVASSSSQFLKNAGSHALLSASSEIDLTLIVKDLLFLEGVKKNLRGILRRDPTPSEWSKAVCMDEPSFALRLAAGMEAKSKMLQSNHRLVLSICSKYTNKGHGVSTQDLVTEGIQGLLKGVEKFDPSKGFKFSTYAHWWIRQAVTRAISEQSRAVRVPAHLYENYQKVQVAKAELLVDLGREPTMAEVSKRTGLSPKHILQVANLALSSVSLDAPLSDDSGASTKGDTIEDNLRATADEVLENEMLKRDIGLMLDELDEKEAGIIKLRFGLLEEIDDAHTSNSLKSIGEKFNVTRERIRQIEAKAVRKLRQRHATNGSVLNDYLTSVASHELVMRRSQGTNKT